MEAAAASRPVDVDVYYMIVDGQQVPIFFETEDLLLRTVDDLRRDGHTVEVRAGVQRKRTRGGI
jgi:hypothetical protein